MKALIKGTFIDEISHDIPHQNWSEYEWDVDFAHMKNMGIDTVILIRCGYKRWVTYPSRVLESKQQVYRPAIDLVDLFLRLSEKHSMKFFFGLYDSGRYWTSGDYLAEVELNKRVIEEVWNTYGHRASFKGWYITQEVSRKTLGIIDVYARLGEHCKQVSNGLPTLISPYVDGRKQVSQFSTEISRAQAITTKQHENEWNEIMDGIKKAIDVVAFQDGQVEYDELPEFLHINKCLADKHGLQCWTNTESFDRDMPIKFLPIKWEKLWLKLEAAARAGIEHAITFEFSHFMSPQSAYLQAGHLYNRYLEYHNNKK